ncbi:MAG: AAA family ATPase [Bacteroidia bacterium]
MFYADLYYLSVYKWSEMTIIGRKKELEIIDRLLQSKESEFLAVYGRRRVGKTFLIREALDNNLVFDCTGLSEATFEQQLLNFWITLSKKFKIPETPPKSWLEAFQFLESYLDRVKAKNGAKKAVFFDEISWYDTPRSGFLQAFTQFWNSYCSKKEDILLVVCGSAASWIINKIVKNKGGLHNRLTQTIRLEAFSLAETKAFLTHHKVKLQNKDIALIYMCIGGVPYYLKQVLPGRGIPQILNDIFLGRNASLKDEFGNLYASLFKNHKLHETVVKALAAKAKGLTRNEIIRITQLASGGGFTSILEELEECGFIMKTIDYNKNKEDGLYRLIDEYTIFYFKFLHKKSEMRSGATLYHSQPFKVWSGFAFENLCFKHHSVIARLLGISGIQYNLYSFTDKGTKHSTGSQIDLIIDRADNVINLVEAKFHNTPLVLTKKAGTDIANKADCFQRKTKTNKAIYVTLISAMGVIKNEHYLSWVTSDIEIDQLF